MKRMSNKDYHAHPALGSTTMKKFFTDPVEAWNEIKTGEKSEATPAMIFGSLVHTCLLEPHLIDAEYIESDAKKPNFEIIEQLGSGKKLRRYPSDVLTPSGQLSKSKQAIELANNMREMNGDVIYVTPSEYNSIKTYIDNADKSIVPPGTIEKAKEIAKKGAEYEFQITLDKPIFFTIDEVREYENVFFERSFFVNIDGVEMKCRPDILIKLDDKNVIVIDIKTTESPAPTAFDRTAASLYFHIQEAHYTRVLEACGYNVLKFIFLMIGKKEGTGAQAYELGPASKDLGNTQLDKAIAKYKLAKRGIVREAPFENGEYDREPVRELPGWVFYES